MKKLLKIILVTILILPTMIYAIATQDTVENKDYYTNMHGVTLTKQQYDNLIAVFDEDTIYTMTQFQIDNLKNATIQSTKEEKYIKTNMYFNAAGEITNITELEISKNEFNNFDKETVTKSTVTGNYETNMKKITLIVAVGNLDGKTITLTNEWKKIPTVKTFDVIAIRGDKVFNIYTPSNNMSGYQKWDDNYEYYSGTGTNTRIPWHSFLAKTTYGAGISMNIVDAVKTSLKNSMTIYVGHAGPITIRGTYQHATDNSVTLSESMNWTPSASGMGGVIGWGTTKIANKYDNTGGLSVSHDGKL